MRERWEMMFELIQGADSSILLWIQEAVRQDWLSPLVSVYTHLGDAGLLWIVLCAGLLCFKPTRRAGFAGMLALVIGFLCTNVVLKHLVGRPRPWMDVAGLVYLVQEGDPNSFPSGHTCSSFAAAAAWWKLLPKKWMKAVGLVMAACMGLSRLYVGVHYPSDVLVGGLVGVLSGLLAWKLCQRYVWKNKIE